MPQLIPALSEQPLLKGKSADKQAAAIKLADCYRISDEDKLDKGYVPHAQALGIGKCLSK